MSEDNLEGEYIPHTDDEPLDDDEFQAEKLLLYSQRIRRDLIDDIVQSGPPKDKENQGVLLMALRDMDTTSINRMKHDVDKAGLENDRAAQEIINQLYKNNPTGLRSAEPVRSVAVTVDTTALDEFEVSESEMGIGIETESAAEFLTRMDSEK